MKFTYIHHSAFCVEAEGKAFVFDYYDGKGVPNCTYHGKMPELPSKTPLYVFSSHSHRDHFSPEVLQWSGRYPNIHYIFAKEVKKKLGNSVLRKLGVGEGVREKITYVKQKEQIELDGVRVETLLSTDSGVAFLVTASGKTIYHAGDLNDWRWMGEPESWNRQMQKNYRSYIEPLRNMHIDAAFIPLDPRQEDYYALGMDYFLSLTGKRNDGDRIYPMHCWEDYGIIDRWLREHPEHPDRNRIVLIRGRGESFRQ